MRSQIRFFLLPIAAFLAVIAAPSMATAQTYEEGPRTVTLLKRATVEGYDNYRSAAFSFKHGTNGDAAEELTKNNWDVLFGNSPTPDAFDVTMVVDDCSRIKVLGKFEWSDVFDIPRLPAHEKHSREPSVPAVVGQMYLVHSKDTRDDHYSLFRVEALEPGKSVTISWKRIASPE
jgi:hypothetical protein